MLQANFAKFLSAYQWRQISSSQSLHVFSQSGAFERWPNALLVCTLYDYSKIAREKKTKTWWEGSGNQGIDQ